MLTLHLKNFVLSVAYRHAMKQNISQLMNASIQRREYGFRNVPQTHVLGRRSSVLTVVMMVLNMAAP